MNIYLYLNKINQKYDELSHLNLAPKENLTKEQKEELQPYKEKALEHINQTTNVKIEATKENEQILIELGILLKKQEQIKELQKSYEKSNNMDNNANGLLLEKIGDIEIQIQAKELELGIKPENKNKLTPSTQNNKKEDTEEEKDEKENTEEQEVSIDEQALMQEVIKDAQKKGNLKETVLEETPTHSSGEVRRSVVADVEVSDVNRIEEAMQQKTKQTIKPQPSAKKQENTDKQNVKSPITPKIKQDFQSLRNSISSAAIKAELHEKIKNQVNKTALETEEIGTTINYQGTPGAKQVVTLLIPEENLSLRIDNLRQNQGKPNEAFDSRATLGKDGEIHTRAVKKML